MTALAGADAGDITKIGVGLIVALVVIGAILSAVITAVLARVFILAVVVVLAVLVWQQRDHVRDSFSARECKLNATFFGLHLDAPDDVRSVCSHINPR